MVLVSLCLPSFLSASEATPTMLDENGCHTCKRACGRFGLQNGTFHCHAIKPNEYKIPMRLFEDDFPGRSQYLLQEYEVILEYARHNISIDPENKILLLKPAKKDPTGIYKKREPVRKLPGLEKHNCNYSDSLIVRKGAPPKWEKVFGVAMPAGMEGIYTVSMGDKEYLGISAHPNSFLLLDKQDNVVCAGDIKKGRVRLRCQMLLTRHIIESTPCCSADYVSQ